ncbi:MAG TPA: nucleoside phosphorylase [Dehalococcoidia bacterium]|nr:nucleoside phosphorylase [Dehalococcoidia bacterium]
MWSTPAHLHDLDDEEHFTAQHMLEYVLESTGWAPADVQVSDVVVGTFLGRTWRRLAQEAHAERVERWILPAETTTLFKGTAGDRPVTVVKFPVGAPATAMVMEVLIACGARRFLILGAAGSLQERAPIGSLVLPQAVLREDGASFHYLPPEAVPAPDPSLTAKVQAACERRGITPLLGTNWSTDAIFREFKKKVEHLRQSGVLCVEMEAATIFSVAAVRGVEASLLLAISDELFRPWAPAFLHDLYRQRVRDAQQILLEVAAELPVPGPASANGPLGTGDPAHTLPLGDGQG